MARTPQKKSAVGIRAYGKVKGTLDGLDGWLKQSFSQHWTTKNEKTGRTFGQELGKVTDEKIAKEAAHAVSDYMADAEFAQSVQEGKILQRLRVYNAEASVITQVDVFDQMLKAIKEAKVTLHDPQSQAYLSAVAAGAQRVLSEIQRNSLRPPVEEDPMDASQDDMDVSGMDLDALSSFR